MAKLFWSISTFITTIALHLFYFLVIVFWKHTRTIIRYLIKLRQMYQCAIICCGISKVSLAFMKYLDTEQETVSKNDDMKFKVSRSVSKITEEYIFVVYVYTLRAINNVSLCSSYNMHCNIDVSNVFRKFQISDILLQLNIMYCAYIEFNKCV